MIKAKIKKTKSLIVPFSKSKFSPPIEEGSIFNDAKFSDWPEVGHSFSFFDTSWGWISTTEVLEILEDRKFRTKNSIYELITLEEEREDKINIIIS